MRFDDVFYLNTDRRFYMEICIFCNNEDRAAENLLVCAYCCQKLLRLTRQQVSDARDAKGEKAELITKLLQGEEQDGTNFKKYIDGKRPTRIFRTNKRPSKRTEK